MTATRPAEVVAAQLVVDGQTTTGHSVVIDAAQFETWATTRVRASRSKLMTTDMTAIVEFRGVRLAKILDAVGVEPGVEDLTLVASDGYRGTVTVHDALTFDITLALAVDGRPLKTTEGGPLFLVFPALDQPEVMLTNPRGGWAWYVTNLVVGTQPASLTVGGQDFDAAALAALPQTTIDVAVSLRNGWPSGPAHVSGPTVRDVLAAAGVSGASGVRVHTLFDAPEHALHLSPDEIEGCGVMIARAYGPDLAPIPARLGGPLVLVFPPGCPERPTTTKWPTFVQSLSVDGVTP